MPAELNKGGEKLFWYFVNERHSIYLKRRAGALWPWTDDVILQEGKFTNIFRELDATTVWMRENITRPLQREDITPQKRDELLLLNCALFRMFGTIEFAKAYGRIIYTWNDDIQQSIERWARARLDTNVRVFTGAYIITNMGITDPKEELVCRRFIPPIWHNRETLLTLVKMTNSLQLTHKAICRYEGWGGGGFMAYELVSDLRWTPILADAKDTLTWANAGPGALRGLERVWGHPVKPASAVEYMRTLLLHSEKEFDVKMELRDIEHSLCEFDKYCRVKLDGGRTKAKYTRPKE